MKNTLLIVVLVLLAIVAIISSFIILTPRMAENRRLVRQVEELQQKLDALNSEVDSIKRETEALKQGDPKAIEKVARDKFGYSREGEVIYKVENLNTAE